MTRAADDFFKLRPPYSELSSGEDFWKAAAGKQPAIIEGFLYRPNKLESPEPPKKWIVRNKTFRNVSFSKTQLMFLEFSECLFEECLFIGSVISDCRFNDCAFVRCNFYRVQFDRCFVDPSAFSRCQNPKKHSNIGVGLYQELLQNSRQQAQPDFTAEAQYQFSRWKRFLLWDELTGSNFSCSRKIRTLLLIFLSWLFEKTTGSGVRFLNLAVTSALLIFFTTLTNYIFRYSLGLELDEKPIETMSQAFYFSTIVMTTLGFGDITPSTEIGRVVVSFQAILGFVTFALLVSMAFRKMAS